MHFIIFIQTRNSGYWYSLSIQVLIPLYLRVSKFTNSPTQLQQMFCMKLNQYLVHRGTKQLNNFWVFPCPRRHQHWASWLQTLAGSTQTVFSTAHRLCSPQPTGAPQGTAAAPHSTLQAKPVFQRQITQRNFAIQPSKGNLIPFYCVNVLKWHKEFLSGHRWRRRILEYYKKDVTGCLLIYS